MSTATWTSMDPLALDPGNGMDIPAQEKTTLVNKGGSEIISGAVLAAQENSTGKRPVEEHQEPEMTYGDVTKNKKKKENEEKELMGKPASVARGATGRILSGTQPPGPASMTGATLIGKRGGQNTAKADAGSSGKEKTSVSGAHQVKSSGGAKSQTCKQEKIPIASPKACLWKAGGGEDQRVQESELKVPPLKIRMPGGSGYGNGGTGQRGGAALPYVMSCSSADLWPPAADAAEKRRSDTKKAGQRVIRSNDGEKVKDKERRSSSGPRKGTGRTRSVSSEKSPLPSSGSGRDSEQPPPSTATGAAESVVSSSSSTELHHRKRKMKTPNEKEGHREAAKSAGAAAAAAASEGSAPAHVAHCNPYQMHIHIRNQIDRRHRSLFPVRPKPPKDFNKYLMNRCTYTLQRNVNPAPHINVPADMLPAMREEFLAQEKERIRLRIQHLVEKEKLVLAVEQEILRVHGRAERAVANQALPYSVCTILRDAEVYNLVTPEAEEKRNAQQLGCNGRQINEWLQEVDDKWEKIKEGMVRRQHTEAETLHAVQVMSWEWRLVEEGICDYKVSPQIEPRHVPQIHVTNFDLPA